MEILKKATPESIGAMSYDERYCFDVQQKILNDFTEVIERNDAIHSEMKQKVFYFACLGAATNLYFSILDLHLGQLTPKGRDIFYKEQLRILKELYESHD